MTRSDTIYRGRLTLRRRYHVSGTATFYLGRFTCDVSSETLYLRRFTWAGREPGPYGGLS